MSQTFPFFLVSNDAGTVAQNVSKDISVTIPQNVRFTCQDLRAVVNSDAATDVNSLGFDIKIQDTGSQQYFMNDFIPRQAICGTVNGGNTGLLPIPLVFAGGTTVTFTVKPTASAGVTSLRIVMAGVREQ